MASAPFFGPARTPKGESEKLIAGNPGPDRCKRHCHHPTVITGRAEGGGDTVLGCPCTENRVECDFEWGSNGRGFCRNCHHASTVTVMESDCRLDFGSPSSQW